MGVALLTTLVLFGVAEAHGAFMIALAVILVTGLLDDLFELPVVLRFGLQIAAVLIVGLTGGTQLSSLGDLFGSGPVNLEAMAIPFTAFAVVGIINALNMSDGLDGYAGGLALVAAVLLAVAGADGGMLAVPVVAAGALGGFLAFNFRHPLRHRASVFMGDCGSMFLGFTLAWLAVSMSQPPQPSILPITAVWILGLPILDTVYVMLRRMAQGRSPFESGRDHFHYLLVDAGMRPGMAVCLLLGVSSLIGAMGVLGQFRGLGEATLCYGFLLLAGAYVIVQIALERLTTRLSVAREPG
jgi:UDP-GlcNAc:undecaprenyl-phosphate/decaprenyl-phosphate GlcNAc-1-phosphate transferase